MLEAGLIQQSYDFLVVFKCCITYMSSLSPAVEFDELSIKVAAEGLIAVLPDYPTHASNVDLVSASS